MTITGLNTATGLRSISFSVESFPTLDPARKSSIVDLTGGNLTATINSAGAQGGVRCTRSQSTGKRYFEGKVLSGDLTYGTFGLGNSSYSPETETGGNANDYSIGFDGFKYEYGAFSFWSENVAINTVVGVLADLDAHTLEYSYNGVRTYGVASTSLPNVSWWPLFGMYFAIGSVQMNFGASGFLYLPAGYTNW